MMTNTEGKPPDAGVSSPEASSPPEPSVATGSDGGAAVGASGDAPSAGTEASATPTERPEPAPAGVDLSFLNTQPPLPSYPAEALPEVLGALFTRLAISYRVPLDMLVTAIWPVLACAIGTSVHLQIAEGICEPALIWILLIADPSSSKTATRMIPIAALQALDELERFRFNPARILRRRRSWRPRRG